HILSYCSRISHSYAGLLHHLTQRHIDIFLLSHHHYQVLLPFPTRRSSDLELAAEAVPAELRHAVAQLAAAADLLAAPPAPGAAQDRKSTRLNSSHEWISYAVFCLKKKKT